MEYTINQVQLPQQFQSVDCLSIVRENLVRTEFNARKKHRQLARYLNFNFIPYQQHINSCLVQKLVRSHQPFYSHSLLFDKTRLSSERMRMHLRGAVNNHCPEKLIDQLLVEACKEKGSVRKRSNISFVEGQNLFYAVKQQVMKVPINSETCSHPKKVISFGRGQQILGVQNFSTFEKLSGKNGTYISAIRLPRKIFLVDFFQGKKLWQTTSKGEYLQVGSTKNNIWTLQYFGSRTNLNSYDMETLQKNSEQFWIQGLVHSKLDATKNHHVLCKYDSLSTFDSRSNKICLQYQAKNMCIQRIYGGSCIKSDGLFSPYLSICQSRHISLFDFRNLKKPVNSRLHHNQQSPPQVNMFVNFPAIGNNTNVLLCYSPYQNGSTLVSSVELSQNTPRPPSLDGFKLLIDEGKISNSFQRFPRSVSVDLKIHQHYNVYIISNEGDVERHVLKVNPQSGKVQYVRGQAGFRRENTGQQKDKRRMLSKYVQVQGSEGLEQVFLCPGEIKKSQTKKKTLKAKEKKVIKSRDQQEIWLKDAQYETESQDPDSLVKRKLNYCNLQNFWLHLHQIKVKADEIEDVNWPGSERKDKDMQVPVTQPFTQTANYDELGDVFWLQKERVMTKALQEKLCQEWDGQK